MKTIEVVLTLEQLQELCRKHDIVVELTKGMVMKGSGKPYIHITVEG